MVAICLGLNVHQQSLCCITKARDNNITRYYIPRTVTEVENRHLDSTKITKVSPAGMGGWWVHWVVFCQNLGSNCHTVSYHVDFSIHCWHNQFEIVRSCTSHGPDIMPKSVSSSLPVDRYNRCRCFRHECDLYWILHVV